MDPREKRRRQIRAAMVLLGVTGAEIALQLGVTRQCVNQVIAGKCRSRRVEEALMAAGVPAKWFAASPSPQPSPPQAGKPVPPGEGEEDGGHGGPPHRDAPHQDACITGRRE